MDVDNNHPALTYHHNASVTSVKECSGVILPLRLPLLPSRKASFFLLPEDSFPQRVTLLVIYVLRPEETEAF